MQPERKPERKLLVPAVLAFVVIGTTALLIPSCGDDDGPVADGQANNDAPDDGGMPDMPPI